MFSKMLIFTFCTITAFIILFASIPSGFFIASYESSIGADKEIAEYYALNNITMYNIQKNFNLSYPGNQQYDMPGISGHKIEYWWNDDIIGGNTFTKVIEVRHLTDQIFGFWWGMHRLDFDDGDPEIQAKMLSWDNIEDRYSATLNGSLFEASCEHINLNLIVKPTLDYATLEDSWSNNIVNIITSYEVNWNTTSVSALNVLGRLLSFQAPALGIPDPTVNGILAQLTASIFWGMVVIMIIKLVQSVFPTVPGIPD